jgi:putative phosphoribosyl transferase
MTESLDVLDPAVRQRGLQLPASARGLVVLVHADAASQLHSGHRFIADVLRANGLATLAITLRPAEEQRLGLPAPGQVEVKHRLRAVFDWLARQALPAGLPMALLGVDDAVRGCVAAAARYRPAALRSLILLDGRPDHVPKLLARLSLPTLMVVGACDARSLSRHRTALRQMNAPSRLEVLKIATRPTPAPGAHQAFAHIAMGWLAKTLWAQVATADAGPAPQGSTLPSPGRGVASAGH